MIKNWWRRVKGFLKKEKYRVTYLLPIIVPGVIITTYFVFYGSFMHCRGEGKPCSPLTSAAIKDAVGGGVRVLSTSYAASASWTLVSGVHFLVSLLAVLTAGIVIYQVLPDLEGNKRWLLILLVVLFSIDVSLLVSLRVSADTSSPAQLLLSATVRRVLPAIHRYNRLFDSLSLTAAISLACAACATLWQRDMNEEPKEKDMVRRVSLLRYVLYVGAALLALSVLRLSASLAWAASFLPPDSDTGKAVATLVSSITTSLGAYFTLVLLGMYLPATMLLRGRAARLAQGETIEEKDDWLKKRGLALSFSAYVPRVLALLGPLLAGPIGELLGRAFGGAPR